MKWGTIDMGDWFTIDRIEKSWNYHKQKKSRRPACNASSSTFRPLPSMNDIIKVILKDHYILDIFKERWATPGVELSTLDKALIEAILEKK